MVTEMPAELFVALEREIPGFHPRVSGAALAEDPLDEFAEELGVPALGDFFRMNPDDVFNDDDDYAAWGGGSLSDPTAVDWWFDADDGLITVRALLTHFDQHPQSVDDVDQLVGELRQFETVLDRARAEGVRFNIAMDA